MNGSLFFRNLRYFTDYEDGDVRGDGNEGTHIYRPNGGLKLDMQKGGQANLPDHEFRASVRRDDILVFCLSMSFSDRLAKEFSSVACVEVLNKREFLKRTRDALEAESYEVHTGPVQYRSPSLPPLHRWALPELVCMTKTPQFLRQDEYRIAFGKPVAFAPENVSIRIVPMGYRDTPQSSGIHQSHTVEIGNIQDLCRLHTA